MTTGDGMEHPAPQAKSPVHPAAWRLSLTGVSMSSLTGSGVMSIKVAIGALAALACASQADARRKPSDVSWAKPGVSFDDYRRDTLECANTTYGLDVSMKPETVVALSGQNTAALAGFVSGLDPKLSGSGSYAGGASGYIAAMNMVDPGRVVFRNSNYTGMFRHAAYVDVTDQLQAVLDFCLTRRGYTRFKLSADQRQQLRHHPRGTEARARFLHALSARVAPSHTRD
ncbi:hypothetical protein [Sphingomonas sp. GC_Shp_4]|uniref:hypothetical protein n=2 Tax=unclassified Sphingomonas TaxID=196159 RepID=UPI00226B9E9A|nr:hypothetical protein [Sphingomonas sp. GC_Shp_4]